MGVSPSGWCFLIVISGLLPVLAIRTALQFRQPGIRAPTPAQHLLSVAFSQGLSLLLALFALRGDRLELFPRPQLGWKEPVLALAFLVPALGTLPLRWRWKPVEELVYRGVLLQLWQRVLGSFGPAALVCVLVFAVSHFVQGWRAMVVIAVLAAASHAIVCVTGDLYTAMFVHVVYDFLAGVILLRLARGDGLLSAESSTSS